MTAQLIPAGNQLVALPEGVSITDWALERVRWQNPRIRALLLASRLLEEILDSNYAILHCSPQRLQEIWRRGREVCDVLRQEFEPLLEHASQVPELEAALVRARLAFNVISRTTLREFERLPAEPEGRDLPQLRKLLCVSIGKLQAFVQDSFCEIIAADPRSLHEADYFLSRRFPRDIEEAEWLHASVCQLAAYLREVGGEVVDHLSTLKNRLTLKGGIPDRDAWQTTARVLDELGGRLTTHLKETLALRGIRFDEMEVLDRYSSEIPSRCQTLMELHASAMEIASRAFEDAQSNRRAVDECVNQLFSSHAVLAGRISALVGRLTDCFLDLQTFVPLWIESIQKRRALLLLRSLGEVEGEVRREIEGEIGEEKEVRSPPSSQPRPRHPAKEELPAAGAAHRHRRDG